MLPGDFASTISKDYMKIGIIGLNSAFLQISDGNFEGKLALHPKQVSAVCGEQYSDWFRKNHINFLLTHHPPSWLTSEILESLIFI